ncbi:MAG TPA: Chromate resistance protein ChrB, partial [Burkholderiaceae bacterium]|nr:Chromate resistance protein ChrB [Burkholderiaceae bacterium]
MRWQLLVLSLPTENATARMRAWRSLKAAGAAVLRDGVYLMPAGEPHAGTLQAVADDVRANGGEAQVFEATPATAAD